jgi:SAM-dependent methyltransferase
VLDEWLEGLPGKPKLLELGAGTGQAAAYVADRGGRVTAIDLSPENVEQCRLRGVDARVGDFGDLDLPDALFDGVWSINALVHVPKGDLPHVVAGVRPVMKRGGSLLIVVWGGRDMEGTIPDDWCVPARFFSFFTDAGLAALRFVGFEVADVRFLENEGDDGLHSQVMTLAAV